jgi:hypothetical protein
MLQRTSPVVHSMQAPLVHCAGAEHGVPFCHCPLVPHVCGVSGAVGLQRAGSPGEHTQQSPPEHPSWHGVFVQCPVPSHSCAVLPVHCLAGAVQSLHSFIAQMVQTIWSTQLPLVLQVWSVVPLQRVADGAQSAQLPPRHASGHAMPSLVQAPSSLQT